jgi:mono/diheme cytochrome c family protein
MKKLIMIVLLLMLAVAGYGAFWIHQHGFSAREEPSWLESVLARHARRIATPAGAKELTNPHPLTETSRAEAREHFVAHCSVCHGLDGSGDTVFGRNMYPKVPDLSHTETQRLTDGELYYIISNGVRFTGMPAFGGEDDPQSIWELVAFIRRLPTLSPEELKLMQKLSSGDGRQQKGESPQPHTHGSEAKPHKH